MGRKQEMLVACIRERAERLRLPDDLPEPLDRDTLQQALAAAGTQLLGETTQDTVIAVFRLAIAEAVRAPEIAATLDSYGRQTCRASLTSIMTKARAQGLLDGRPSEMAEQFAALLWGDLMVSLLSASSTRRPPDSSTGVPPPQQAHSWNYIPRRTRHPKPRRASPVRQASGSARTSRPIGPTKVCTGRGP